jgi:PAS domain S-box-containing protein
VVVVDRDQRVVAANRRYFEVFGAMRPDVAGVVCHEALHCPEIGTDAGVGECAACQAVSFKEPQRALRSLRDSKGAPRRWDVTFNPVLDSSGEVSYVVEVWRDITERSRLESQLSHSERLASLGILAAGVAHEVNNPMASVLAGVESLERWLARGHFDLASVAEARDVLAVLENAARRCSETTNKLMLLAQPYTVAPSWLDLNRAVRDTLSLLRYEMRKRNVQSVEDLQPDLPPMWAREGGVRGVCMNLMLNAVQAMPEGGTLTTRTTRAGDRVVLEVEDTGHGIRPEHLDRIWDPFFTTKPTGQGTGLGLSITQRIVERHGGAIRVESAPGQGAKFTVELPIAGTGGSSV